MRYIKLHAKVQRGQTAQPICFHAVSCCDVQGCVTISFSHNENSSHFLKTIYTILKYSKNLEQLVTYMMHVEFKKMK